jgi:hypothetical protein
MNDLLIFTDEKTGDRAGMHYRSWLSIIRGILVKYARRTVKDANAILEKSYYRKPEDYQEVVLTGHETEYHWAMLGAHGEQYWLKGVSPEEPDGYFEWYDTYIKENNLKEPFEWFINRL